MKARLTQVHKSLGIRYWTNRFHTIWNPFRLCRLLFLNPNEVEHHFLICSLLCYFVEPIIDHEKPIPNVIDSYLLRKGRYY